MRLFWAIRDFWWRVTHPQTFTDQLWHDAGHALTAIAVTAASAIFLDLPFAWDVCLGWLVPVVIVEGFKDLKRRATAGGRRFPSPDSVHDVATYLPHVGLWLIFIEGNPPAGIALLVAVASSFVGYYYQQFEKRWGKVR